MYKNVASISQNKNIFQLFFHYKLSKIVGLVTDTAGEFTWDPILSILYDFLKKWLQMNWASVQRALDLFFKIMIYQNRKTRS